MDGGAQVSGQEPNLSPPARRHTKTYTPAQHARRVAWGHKWGQMVSQATKEWRKGEG